MLPIGHRVQIAADGPRGSQQRRPAFAGRAGHDRSAQRRDRRSRSASRTTASGSIRRRAAARPPRPRQSPRSNRRARRHPHHPDSAGERHIAPDTRADLSTRPTRGARRMTDQRPPTSCACWSSTITKSSARDSPRFSTARGLPGRRRGGDRRRIARAGAPPPAGHRRDGRPAARWIGDRSVSRDPGRDAGHARRHAHFVSGRGGGPVGDHGGRQRVPPQAGSSARPRRSTRGRRPGKSLLDPAVTEKVLERIRRIATDLRRPTSCRS